MCLDVPPSASLTCALKQTNFTGDLLVDDNGADWCGKERGVGAFYKGTNEAGVGVKGLFAGPLGQRAWRQRDAKHL